MSLTSENQDNARMSLLSATSDDGGEASSNNKSTTSLGEDSIVQHSTSSLQGSSILDQLTKSTSSIAAEKGATSVSVGGSGNSSNGSVMPNIFPAGGAQTTRQDPASSIPCNTTIGETLSPQLDQPVGEEKEDSAGNGHKKKTKAIKNAIRMDDGEKEVFIASLRGKKVQSKAVCSNCGNSDTPTWRKGPLGIGTLCNACGIKHSTSSIYLDPDTGAQFGMRPHVKLDDLTPGELAVLENSVEVKTEEIFHSSSSSPATSQHSMEGTSVPAVSTPEKQGKRSRGRPKGSGNKKKQPPLEATVAAVSTVTPAVELPQPTVVDQPVATPQLEPTPQKRGRGRPRTKPFPASQQAAVQPKLTDIDTMVDDDSTEHLTVGSGKGKRKRKTDDDGEYVPEEEKVIVTQKPKQRKVVTLPVGSDAQVLSLQNLQKTFSNTPDNCIYISSDYLMQCVEGFKLTIKQGSKKNNGEINRRITTDSLVYIFFFLDMSDLLSCFSVCRHWRESAKSDVIWKETYRRSWGIDEKSLAEYTTGIVAQAPSIDWFNLVQARVNIRVYSPIQQIHFMSQFYAIENKPKILACMQENLNEEITARKNNTPKL